MARSSLRPKRQISSKKYIDYRKKKLYELAGRPALTRVGEKKKKVCRTLGGGQKQKLLEINTVNVLDQKTNKYQKAKIVRVLDNPANRHYTRRNILTKGSIIETDLGKARITSRPGQEGTVNAVLVEE